MDNERVEKLEMITKRLMRRAVKHTTAIITPYPISAAIFGDKVEGPILRYMFSCDGVITKGMVRIGNKPKGPVLIELKMFNDLTLASKGFALEKKSLAISPDLKVVAGDCLEISLNAGDEIITEAWVALLWTPTMNDVTVKNYLIEGLEDDLQKREKSLTAE